MTKCGGVQITYCNGIMVRYSSTTNAGYRVARARTGIHEKRIIKPYNISSVQTSDAKRRDEMRDGTVLLTAARATNQALASVTPIRNCPVKQW